MAKLGISWGVYIIHRPGLRIFGNPREGFSMGIVLNATGLILDRSIYSVLVKGS